jgi:hypothetical protein
MEISLRRLERRHETLLRKLCGLGLVMRGSIVARRLPCGNPKCRCKDDPPRLHGPYYLWTRKVAAKTVSVYLTAEKARRCMPWSRNMRQFDRLVKQLQQIGLRAAYMVYGSPPS